MSTGPEADVARRRRGTQDHRRMRRGTEATWQGRGWPTCAWVTRVRVSYSLYNIHIISLFLELANLSHLTPYLTASFPVISSVWDYVPTRFLFCRTRGSARRAGCGRNGRDRVDPSPRDHRSKHVLKEEFK